MSDFWKNRRVLVTGGTGFLGFHLCKQLCELGAQVRSFALPEANNYPGQWLPIEFAVGDIRDAPAVRKAVQGCDVVFHTAGNVAVWGPGLKTMREVHVDGTRNLLAASQGVWTVVHTSSIVAVGATTNGTVLNEDSPFPLSEIKVDYVHAKKDAEELALEANAIVVNPGYLIGPEDYEPSVMGKFCDRVWKGKMALAAPGGYNLVDVRDVARGHILAAECGRPGRKYILGGSNLQMKEFMQMLLLSGGFSPRLLPTLPMKALWLAASLAEVRSWKTKREPYPSFQHARLTQYQWFVSSERAKTELGYRSRSITNTLNDLWDWYLSEKSVRLRGMTKWWMRPKVSECEPSKPRHISLVRPWLETHLQ